MPSSISKPDNTSVSLTTSLLGPLIREYLVYLDLNAKAWSRGDAQFTATFQGVESQVWRNVFVAAVLVNWLFRFRQCHTECGAGLSFREEWKMWGERQKINWSKP